MTALRVEIWNAVRLLLAGGFLPPRPIRESATVRYPAQCRHPITGMLAAKGISALLPLSRCRLHFFENPPSSHRIAIN